MELYEEHHFLDEPRLAVYSTVQQISDLLVVNVTSVDEAEDQFLLQLLLMNFEGQLHPLQHTHHKLEFEL